MKKSLILLLSLLLCLSLFACGTDCTEHTDENGDGICDVCGATDTEKGDTGSDLVLVNDSKTLFSIVCSLTLSDKSKSYVSNFIFELNEHFISDADLELKLDTPEDNDGGTEIIFGSPKNRGEQFIKDEHYLGYKGFSIEVIGNKLFVLAGGDAGYQSAIKYLKDTLFNLEGYLDTIDTLIVPKDTKYEKLTTGYEIAEVSIAGKSAREFVITYNSTSSPKTAAGALQDALYKKGGIWVPYATADEVTSEQSVIYVLDTKEDADRSTEGGAIVYVKDGDLYIECEFSNKFEDFMSSFISSKLSKTNIQIDSDYTYTKDVRNIYYKDFGAVGDGVTDDFFAIKDCHYYANLYGHTVNSDGPNKTYYIGNYLTGSSTSSIIVQTDTNWHGCTFIFDDSKVPTDSACRMSAIFLIKATDKERKFSGSGVPVKSLMKGATDLGDWAPGTECLLYIVNSNERHYIRYGSNANNGSSQHEILYVHADGTIDPSTPLQWDYETVTSLTVYPCDTDPITVTGGDGNQRATVITIANGARSTYDYFDRNIRITRSNVTLRNIDHLVEGEVPESQGGTGAPYNGFTAVNYANNVTVENLLIHNLVGYHLETDPTNGMGSYEISAKYSNNVLWKNVTQDVFFDADGGVSYEGLMGTSYCKNLTFDGNFICSFDAHAGVYNATIKNSTVEHLNFIGDGLITVENTTIYVDGAKTAIRLRSDYGSTWAGDVYMKNVDLKYEMKTKDNNNISVVSSSWVNHDFGYTCYLPQHIYMENVRTIGFDVVVENGVRQETVVEINKKQLYLFTSGTVYKYAHVDISDPTALVHDNPNDLYVCGCETFNDTDGDGRCNNNFNGTIWCWGLESEANRNLNINPYIGTKSVTVINSDPTNPLSIVWPFTPQFKDLDVTVDGVLIVEDGKAVE